MNTWSKLGLSWYPTPPTTVDKLRNGSVRVLPQIAFYNWGGKKQWSLQFETPELPVAVKLGKQISSESKYNQYSKEHRVKRILESWSYLRLNPNFLRSNCIPSLLSFGYTPLLFSDLYQYLSNKFPFCLGFLRWIYVARIRVLINTLAKSETCYIFDFSLVFPTYK